MTWRWSPPPDPEREWCRSDLSTTLNPNEPQSALHWACYRRDDGAYVQIQSAELSTLQASALANFYLESCSRGMREGVENKLCEPIEDFIAKNYKSKIASEFQERLTLRDPQSYEDEDRPDLPSLDEDAQRKLARFTPFSDLKVDEAIRLVDLLNGVAEREGAVYRYGLMNQALWRELYGDYAVIECTERDISAVYDNSGDNSKDGCGFERPRGVISSPDGVRCVDPISVTLEELTLSDPRFEEVHFEENRSFDPSNGELLAGKLCDIKGNMRELILSCEDDDSSYSTCSDGWGWKGDPSQLEKRIQELDGGHQNNEVGLRFIRVYQGISQ